MKIDVMKILASPFKGLVKKWILDEMAEKQEEIINKVLKIKLPKQIQVSGEVEEAIIRGIYDEFEKDIKLLIESV